MTARGKIVFWAIGMGVVGLLAWGVFVYQGRHVSPLGVSPVQDKGELAAVLAKFGTPRAMKLYKIKKTMNMMGMNVVRIENRQYPQEFVVVNDLSDDFVSDVFDQKMDTGMMESMVNEALKLKMSGKNVSMAIRKIAMQDKGTMNLNGQSLPLRRVRVVFKLSNESNPRAYEGEMIREAGANNLDTLVVSFTRAPLEKEDMLKDDRHKTDDPAKPGADKKETGGLIKLSKPPKPVKPVKTAAFKPELLEAFVRMLAS